MRAKNNAFIRASVLFFPPARGGRPSLPIGDGYAPDLRVATLDHDLAVIFYNLPFGGAFDTFYPIGIELRYYPRSDYWHLKNGGEFEIIMGPRIEGRGRVESEVIGLNPDGNKQAPNIIQRALEKNQLADLLVGSPAYRYLPKYTSSPYVTDLGALLGNLYDACPPDKRVEIARSLATAVREIVKRYEGIIPSAMVILIESSRKKDGRAPLGLPLESLASELGASIAQFRQQLASDKSGGGRNYPDGLLGELRRLDAIVVDLGGPSIFIPRTGRRNR